MHLLAGLVAACFSAHRGLGQRLLQQPPVDAFQQHPRVVVLSDIGNEPDDQMSMVRLLLYSNELDLEALVATTSTWQRSATHPETMRELIAAYGQVRANLMLHATGWPTAESLAARVSAGQPDYGLAATGPGKSSPGSRAIEAALEQADSRPLWICLWGGANTLAQTLIDLRASLSPTELQRAISRIRVSSISDQDDAGPWIRREFPGLFYIVQPSAPDSSAYAYATWTGISGDMYYRNGDGADSSLVTNAWLDANIRSKGPLGKVYPRYLFIMEGDTPSFLNLLNNGLDAYQRPDWGGWGGRYLFLKPFGESHSIWTQGGDQFTRNTSQDTVRGIDGREHTSDQATIWRWRPAFQNDFAARMDWTLHDFAHANHAPVAIVNGASGTAPLEISVRVGETLTLDAGASSDPDRQALQFRWWLYPEAGTNGGPGAAVTIASPDAAKTEVMVTAGCRPMWLPLLPCPAETAAHIILMVKDTGSPPLTAYRRIVLHIHP